jgi:hypothetical protein
MKTPRHESRGRPAGIGHDPARGPGPEGRGKHGLGLMMMLMCMIMPGEPHHH